MPKQIKKHGERNPNEPAGPSGKFNTDRFSPEIWSTRRENWLYIDHRKPSEFDPEQRWGANDDQWSEILICAKQRLHTRDLGDVVPIPKSLPPGSVIPDKYVTSRMLLHPVAIVLTHPVYLLFGLPGNFGNEHRKWIVNDIDTKGIKNLSAQAAIAAAWKGFGEGNIGFPNERRATFKFTVPYRTLGFNTERPQDRTQLRDIALWINWDHWERHHIPMKRRAEILEEWGYECTLKALRKVKEHVGV